MKQGLWHDIKGMVIAFILILVVALIIFIPRISDAKELLFSMIDDFLPKEDETITTEEVQAINQEVARIGDSVYRCYSNANECGCIQPEAGPVSKEHVNSWLISNKKDDSNWNDFRFTWEIGKLEKNRYYLLEIKKDADCMIHIDYTGDCVFISEIMDPQAYGCPT